MSEEEKIETKNNGNNGNNDIDVETLEKKEINLKDLDENRVIGSRISHEMKQAYIDYAMSVIVSRALPIA